ncbi:MAG: hypothetical protein CMI74_07200 [Candidatus Pelagibacter sp.]|jgi:hypothetical protein|nr:hypothetical protein [Candidatus Pelagibacter sp.]|tara:strand:- start:14632 stop:14844 length:213 start_codon:yes stop_codon:yes gene_type:complete
MKDGPFKEAMEEDHGNLVIKQEFSTIKIVNNVLVKEVVTRDYDFFGDYIDSRSSQPLAQLDKIITKETMH